MLKNSERFFEEDGSPYPITQQELASRVGEIPGYGVILQPLTVENAQAYFDLVDFDRDHLSQFGDITASKYQTVEEVIRSFDENDEDYNPFKLRFGVWNDGAMIGTINLMPSQDKKAEVGYWIGKEHLGRGYGAKALNSLVNFAFVGLGYEELEAEVEIDNKYSRGVLEKCGFIGSGAKGYVSHGTEKTPKHNRIYWTFVKQKPE